ncbi:bifunctional diaminohydroxyphosphoribosylaminopyrimidine deaminase/5-amino-6-(5-phosphoribosylamino)uracil reductase RibD [Aurantibacter aestuarii]|uniref:Riboflavin biosynthesis protein RibD n=1 Tax=Aurantibacter aestuarii TaxID=1266046 RepID=A0A2T1N999_9FLAO|nr:bifunctional diaminohydroxyphosphoribosylaminopyrimidine deaminase/5-amino-6-(5-phosphoribosylamino)uracil reductase RibD [Aurantibacter aestuarii]PSG88457.1 bifunctional diaminohydroxyphosphoribosylaminopyrimidine deaminase/5-amino-6-(5-phosphoribosylamino)uracil reductase RibD [Aurantibacter aestuarii]
MNTHQTYMNRALQIAKNGLGFTRPNPMVGAVIVHQNKIIGEGFTSTYGGNHAEVNAINSVKNHDLLAESTIYVTLEPCSHYGKTPPCSDLIIAKGIKNVVIGCVDDNPQVAGKGIKKLLEANCKVTVGILESECKVHHKRFFTFHNKKRPFIILKWAQSSDGFLSPETKDDQKPVWITNKTSRALVHKWRGEEQAILVGTNTVLQDNPSLTTRNYAGQNPIRVVIDKYLKLDLSLAVFNAEAETLVISKHTIDWTKTNAIAQQICEVLHQKNITSIIIEGGTKTLQTFIDENLWDEARIFKGTITFKKGTKAPVFNEEIASKEVILEDTLEIYNNKNL